MLVSLACQSLGYDRHRLLSAPRMHYRLYTVHGRPGTARHEREPLSPQYRSVRVMDGRGGWSGGLWPVAVSGAFDMPLDEFAFDESRVRSLSPGRVEPPAEQPDRVSPAVVTLREKIARR